MEKLIELLNEYDSGWDYDDYYGPYQYGQDRDAYIYGKYYLVSRDYGFIKWLVENDKIDTDAYKTVYSGDLDKWKTLTMSSGGDEFYQVTEHGVYESLLMLLSISSSPIEDLLLYLK